MNYEIRYVRGHVEVYDQLGRFRFSADSEWEALEELTRRHAEPERRDAIAHYARGNFAQAQFVARLEEVYQSAVRDFQIRGGQAV